MYCNTEHRIHSVVLDGKALLTTGVTLATRCGAARTRHSWTTGGLAKVSMTAAGLWFSQRTPRPTTRGCALTIHKKPSGCGLTTSTSSVLSTVGCKLLLVSYTISVILMPCVYLINWVFANRLSIGQIQIDRKSIFLSLIIAPIINGRQWW